MNYSLVECDGDPAIFCVEGKHSVIVAVAGPERSKQLVTWLNEHRTPIQDFRDWALGEDIPEMEDLWDQAPG